jgi:hypothetical protein
MRVMNSCNSETLNRLAFKVLWLSSALFVSHLVTCLYFSSHMYRVHSASACCLADCHAIGEIQWDASDPSLFPLLSYLTQKRRGAVPQRIHDIKSRAMANRVLALPWVICSQICQALHLPNFEIRSCITSECYCSDSWQMTCVSLTGRLSDSRFFYPQPVSEGLLHFSLSHLLNCY